MTTSPAFVLTAYRRADTPALYHLISTNPEVTKWTGLPLPYQLSDAEWFLDRASVDRIVDTDKPRRFFVWAIRDRTTDALIGSIGVHPIARGGSNMKTDNPEYKSLLVDYMPEGEYMIGYYIDKEYYGRGIMTGVVKAVTERVLNGIVDDTVFDKERDHVDQVVRVPRLNAEYYEGNMGSPRVLIKNGFVEQEKCSIRIWRASGKPVRSPWLVKTCV